MKQMTWTREPEEYTIGEDRITITTAPHTDLWQRTYYHFCNDNAPLLQMETDEKDGFHSAICWLPDYKWEKIQGYSEEEIKYFQRLVEANSSEFMKAWKEHFDEVTFYC